MRQQKTAVKARRAVAHKAPAAPVKRSAPVVAPPQRKGFNVMTKAERVRIATLGGIKVGKNKRHMAEIGRVGGQNRTLTPDQRERSRAAARSERAMK